MTQNTRPISASLKRESTLGVLLLGALGVVYGDIGTSPLYALRTCLDPSLGIEPIRENVLGILSLIVWALILIICVKYMVVVLRADNKGEGGIIALMALALSKRTDNEGPRYRTILFLGLFGASLLYSDGMITPAVSVLGALEGLAVVQPELGAYIVPLASAILLCLFLVQRHGTGRLGGAFGPIIIVWFVVIAVLGALGIARQPHVMWAINPIYLVRFLAHDPWTGFRVLGSVLLAVTGAEALYADMGHFGRRPIRIDWFVLVFPALLLNYFGQGALILHDPSVVHNPFYSLAPRWALVPLILLATAAAIIASQAVISGAFSLTRQAVLLGFLPRLRVIHTSSMQRGQIYIPMTNWVLMVATIGLVIGFKSSQGLASAYGVAVTTDMVFTTLLLFIVARSLWGWRFGTAAAVCGVFLVVDLAFFSATLLKVVHGGWFPILVALSMFVLMVTWRQGRAIVLDRLGENVMSLEDFAANITQGEHRPARVPGAAIFMTANPHGTPRALGHNIKHNKIIHERVVALTIIIADEPYVAHAKRVEVKDLGMGFWRILAHYGFMESPSVPEILELAGEKGVKIPLFGTAFFVGRENILITRRKDMARWRQGLFSVLARNSQSATDFYGIPPNQVVEIGLQVEL
jgi:KUP system potassium uptake protein